MSQLRQKCSECNFETEDLNISICPKCGKFLMKISKGEEEWIGETIESKYKIIRIIGKGGMGFICKAEQLFLGREVAIKLLRKEFCCDEKNIRLFLKEAKAASKLKHLNIVMVYDSGQTRSGELYLAMELLSGHTLREELESKKKLTFDRTKEIISQVCDALTHAHDKGVVHCDLKPENIFIVKEDDKEIVKVLDFGIAKIIGGKTQTNVGFVAGTAEYISPEQIEGKDIDGRADLYSLACLTYECLTGQPPYTGSSPYGIIALHLSRNFESVYKLTKNLPSNLDSFFEKALSKSPSLRFSKAVEFKEAFLNLEKFSTTQFPFLKLETAQVVEVQQKPNFWQSLSLWKKITLSVFVLISILFAVGLILLNFPSENTSEIPLSQGIASDEEAVYKREIFTVQKDVQEAQEIKEVKKIEKDLTEDLYIDSEAFISETTAKSEAMEQEKPEEISKELKQFAIPKIKVLKKKKKFLPQKEEFQIKIY